MSWPPVSPDLTPLNCSLWDFVKDVRVFPVPDSSEALRFQTTQAILQEVDVGILSKIVKNWTAVGTYVVLGKDHT